MAITCLKIIQSVAYALNLPEINSINEQYDSNTRMLMSCLNQTAEELSIDFAWIEQLAKCTLIADGKTFYDTGMDGYDLQLATANQFDRFTTSYLYNIAEHKKIAEILPDEKIERDSLKSQTFYKFMRLGNFLIFVPTLPLNYQVDFYYQRSSYAYTQNSLKEKTFYPDFSYGEELSLLDAKLLIRGTISKYRRASGDDNSQEEKIFQDYKEALQNAHSPQAMIKYFDYRLDGISANEMIFPTPVLTF